MKLCRDQSKPKIWASTRTQNLVRNISSGQYYARFRSNGKLVWRSLNTDVYTTAKLRLPDKIEEEQRLIAAGDGQITFAQAAKIYLDRIQQDPGLKPRTKEYHEQRMEALVNSWPGIEATRLRSISKDQCLKWAAEFAAEYSPSSFNHTLGILRAVFEIGIDKGARYDNPAKAIERLAEKPKRLRLPELQQFNQFVAALDAGGGRDSRNCADLVRFLAYGGFRITEARYVTWTDCDFNRGEITVHGHPETGTKGRGDARRIPMIPEMRVLLERLRSERPTEPDTSAVMRVHECQKAMDRAASEVGMARITHHDLRHLFATRCIESGVDIPTVSRWLGHRDGGALAMRVYGHLRSEHSLAMAQKVSFKPAGNEVPARDATLPPDATG
ncbi:MAG: tyrosine-type recombinase/integrase [Verrucomicrobiia bacterium]